MEIDEDLILEPRTINCDIIPHTAITAFAFYLEQRMTVRSYALYNQDLRAHNCRVLIPYDPYIKEEMKRTLPKNLYSDESRVTFSLQDLSNVTAERACQAYANEWAPDSIKKMRLVLTAGFDSSSGHTNSQQKFKDTKHECTDAQRPLLVTNVLIVQLNTTDGNIIFIKNFYLPKFQMIFFYL